MALFLKNLLFTLLVPGSVAFYLPLLISSSATGDRIPEGIRWLGLAPLALGVAIYLWCAWDFATFGRGTPAPIDAPTRLVVRGLYRYVRNPMYVGVLTAIAGWALYFASAKLCLYAATVWTAFHLFVVLYEEPNLHERFGADYERYCAGVNRWLAKPRAHTAA